MKPAGHVTIDFFPDSVLRYVNADAVVCIDVLRTATTLVTSVSQGRRTYVAPSAEEAWRLAVGLRKPVLAASGRAGSTGGFEMGNSPRRLSDADDWSRPFVLAAGAGARLIANAAHCRYVFIACFRNLNATVEALAAGAFQRIAIVGAGARGHLPCEDVMAVAWLADALAGRGYALTGRSASELVGRWKGADPALVRLGNSAEYLRRSGQEHDIDFVLSHFDDIEFACSARGNEIRPYAAPQAARSVETVSIAANANFVRGRYAQVSAAADLRPAPSS